MLIKTDKDKWHHRADIPKDDGGPITFKWHFPRGTLSKRMSALELTEFIIFHMPGVLPLLGGAGNERVQSHFEAMLVTLATTPKDKLDELLPWIKSVCRQEDDDVIEMRIDAKETEAGKLYFT